MVGTDLAVAEIAAAGHAVAHGDLGAALILAALVGGAVLQAFDVEALRIELDAAAEHLRAFEGGAAAALQGGGALAAADMAAEVGGFVAVAIAFRTRPSERLMFQTALSFLPSKAMKNKLDKTRACQGTQAELTHHQTPICWF